MAEISKFGLRRIKAIVPAEIASKFEAEGAPREVPTGDFGIAGERHDQLSHGDFRSRYEHLSRYAAVSNTKWGTVADIGCGTGYGSAMLSKLNRVFGIDTSRKAVEYARTQYPSIDFILGSAERIPVCDACLDAVFAFEVIEHLREPERLLAECRRVLRIGGALVLSTPNPGHLGNVWQHRLLGRQMPAKVDMSNPYHMREFAYDEMRKLLGSNGFEVVWARGQTIPFDWCVPGLGRFHSRIAPKVGASDVYEWILSVMGSRLPRFSWTVTFTSKRL